MKSLLSSLLFVALLAGCGDKKKVTTTTEEIDGEEVHKTTTTTSADPEEIASTATDMERKIAELKKLKSLTTEQLKAALPAEIGSMPRSRFETNAMMGYAVAEADYKNGDNELKLTLYDCAGEAGSTIYGINYFTRMSFEQESETEYTKSVDFKGGRAVEQYNKRDNNSELTFLSADRLLVNLKGQNMKPEALRTIAEGLSFPVN